MIIRPMEDRDLPAVSAIESASFSVPWSLRELTECLHREYYDFFVAEEDETVLGYIGLYRVLDEADIATIAVADGVRHRGIGEGLMGVALSSAKLHHIETVLLEVRDSNLPAIHLYEKLGFRQIGTRCDYYRLPTEDARIYALSLPADTE